MKTATETSPTETPVLTPMVDGPAESAPESTTVEESSALDSLTAAATDGAPVLQSDVDSLCQRIRRNRLAHKAGSNPALARYLVAPNRKSLGL